MDVILRKKTLLNPAIKGSWIGNYGVLRILPISRLKSVRGENSFTSFRPNRQKLPEGVSIFDTRLGFNNIV